MQKDELRILYVKHAYCTQLHIGKGCTIKSRTEKTSGFVEKEKKKKKKAGVCTQVADVRDFSAWKRVEQEGPWISCTQKDEI